MAAILRSTCNLTKYSMVLLALVLFSCAEEEPKHNGIDDLVEAAEAKAACGILEPGITDYIVKEIFLAASGFTTQRHLDNKKLKFNMLEEKYRSMVQKNAGDTREYQKLILGDSTMQITSLSLMPTLTPFYNDSTTQLLAITGNKLCDMIYQLKFIKSSNPSTILISSAGGNDALVLKDFKINGAEISKDDKIMYIANKGRELFSLVRAKFPNARIAFVALHPSLDDFANEIKGATNQMIGEYVKRDPNACWYDPIELFGVAEGEAARKEDMLDTAHYQPGRIGLALKTKLKKVCLIDF